MVSDRRTVGWTQTDHTGPCVDPFDHGAHMANGGIVNVARKDEETPPVMCLECYEAVRELQGPPEVPQ